MKNVKKKYVQREIKSYKENIIMTRKAKKYQKTKREKERIENSQKKENTLFQLYKENKRK